MKYLALVFIVIVMATTAFAGPVEDSLLTQGFEFKGKAYVRVDKRMDIVESIEIKTMTDKKYFCYRMTSAALGNAALFVAEIMDENRLAKNMKHNLIIARLKALKLMLCPKGETCPDTKGAKDA
jgi:hypothetical protein